MDAQPDYVLTSTPQFLELDGSMQKGWLGGMGSKNMARIAFEKIMAGLEDALAYADGDISRGAARQVVIDHE